MTKNSEFFLLEFDCAKLYYTTNAMGIFGKHFKFFDRIDCAIIVFEVRKKKYFLGSSMRSSGQLTFLHFKNEIIALYILLFWNHCTLTIITLIAHLSNFKKYKKKLAYVFQSFFCLKNAIFLDNNS